MMTKGILTSVVLCGLLAGPACAGSEPAHRLIAATFYPIQIAVLNVTAGVEGITVVNLASSATGCLHDYQLTPRDRAILSRADLVVANGAGMESFMDVLIRQKPPSRIIDASAGIGLLVSAGVTNSHVWLSPSRHIRQIRAIAGGLVAWDPAHAADYRANAERYERELVALKAKMDRELAGLRTREIITFHEAFPYFADEFRLKIAGVIEREPGTEPSAGELAALIRQVKASGVKALFVEPQYPVKAAEAISRETGAGLYPLDPVVSGPVTTNAYLEVMEGNLIQLRRALK
jgi:zinc transport system substrate-binding protein